MEGNEKKGGDEPGINELLLASKKISSINAEILKKLSENEQIVERLNREAENLKRKGREKADLEVRSKEDDIRKLGNDLLRFKEQFLISEAALRKKEKEFSLLMHQYEQLKRSHSALTAAFSKAKNDYLGLAAEREHEIKDDVNEKREISVTLLAANNKLKELCSEIDEMRRANELMNEENRKLKKELLMALSKNKESIKEGNDFGPEKQHLRRTIAEKEAEIKRLMDIQKAIRIDFLEKSGQLSKLKDEVERERKEKLLLLETLRRLKESFAEETDMKKKGKRIPENERLEINALRAKLLGAESEKKAIVIDELKYRKKYDETHKDAQLKEILIGKLKKEIEELRAGYLNEMRNRKVLEEYGSRIDELRRQVIESGNTLRRKDREIFTLHEENKVLKEQLDIELKSRESEKQEEAANMLRREADELRMLLQQERENSSKQKDYYTKLLEMQKAENEERIDSIARQSAEREVELNSAMQELSAAIEEKNRKIEQQKQFYLDVQRLIRQNLLESGLLKEEEARKKTERNAVLDFMLRKIPKQAEEKSARETRKSGVHNIQASAAGKNKVQKIEVPPMPIGPGVKMAGIPPKDDKVEEIMEIINIAKQHGDADEQIKISLRNSGYNGQEIERAFSQAKVKNY